MTLSLQHLLMFATLFAPMASIEVFAWLKLQFLCVYIGYFNYVLWYTAAKIRQNLDGFQQLNMDRRCLLLCRAHLFQCTALQKQGPVSCKLFFTAVLLKIAHGDRRHWDVRCASLPGARVQFFFGRMGYKCKKLFRKTS